MAERAKYVYYATVTQRTDTLAWHTRGHGSRSTRSRGYVRRGGGTYERAVNSGPAVTVARPWERERRGRLGGLTV